MYWVLSILPKISEISVGNQMENLVRPQNFPEKRSTFEGGPLWPIGPVTLKICRCILAHRFVALPAVFIRF